MALGSVAQTLGLLAVFQSVAGGVTVGAVLIAGIGLLERYRLRRSAGEDASNHGGVDVAAGDDAHHAAVGSSPLQAGRH